MTITVTAEINAVDCRDEEETIVIQDPYAGLSYEDRLQIIRLSYDDVDLSRSTPRTESQMTTAIDGIRSPSPTLDSFEVSINDLHPNLTVNGIGNHDDDVASTTEDDILSMGESPSSLESSTTDQPIEHQNRFPVNSVSSSQYRLNSLTSPSGSSIDASSTESDRLSSPEQSKRDSGYENANGAGSVEDEIERAQFEKLLYFQRQLAKQHEELARLGIHVPMPGSIQQSAQASPKHRPKNGQYTSA